MVLVENCVEQISMDCCFQQKAYLKEERALQS